LGRGHRFAGPVLVERHVGTREWRAPVDLVGSKVPRRRTNDNLERCTDVSWPSARGGRCSGALEKGVVLPDVTRVYCRCYPFCTADATHVYLSTGQISAPLLDRRK
jgi:hypothetical protein